MHGFTGRGDDFEGFSRLCGLETKWHCPDLPGHGPAPTVACAPQAMVEFINGQTPAKPRVALGYSMGARAALLHAISCPDHWDALILISATAGLESEVERGKRAEHDQMLAERLLREGVTDFLRYWQQTPVIQSQQNIRSDWLERMQANRRQHTAKGLAASLLQFGQAQYPKVWDRLDELNCPVLLITGEQDDKYCAFAKRMQTLLPNAQWRSISGAGHMPHMEAPKQTAAVIKHFRKTALGDDASRTS